MRSIHTCTTITLIIALAIGTSCQSLSDTVSNFNVYTPQEEAKMGVDAYSEVLGKEKKSTDAEANALVERVGKRLAAVVPGSEQFQWEFNLFESDTINAFCLPGGKVAIYTGILPYCENEAALAAVMGHEIGHAVARHGGKRMTEGAIVGGVQTGLAAVLQARGITDTTTNLTLAAVGGLTQVGVTLPFSRGHELEADNMGLEYMAKAGYDPKEAVAFWKRFATLGSNGPAFLSTHPASEERAQKLAAKIDAAEQWYAAAPVRSGAGASVPEHYRKK